MASRLCEQCGEPLGPNARFCPGCGERNPDFKAKQARCTACGQDVGTKDEIETGKVKFCRNCGSENATIEADE